MHSVTIPTLLRLTPEQKRDLRILLLAKHADATGDLDAADGNHAVYHCELRETLLAIGLNVQTANRYEALFAGVSADFVVPLLNRGGFQNSEMLAPLLFERMGVPYLGARPMQRGWSDDKHLAKLAAVAAGVPTARWACFRVGQPMPAILPFDADRFIVKPNASSASWGVAICDDASTALEHARTLIEQRYDAIVEQWLPARDIAVPVIGGTGRDPWHLTPMAYSSASGSDLRSYEEKRGLVPTGDDPLEPIADRALLEQLHRMTEALARDYWPFDYGRFEYRHDPETGALSFMEVNLSCNLWSRKTISRAARRQGISHVELVEHILTHSLKRQDVLAKLPMSAAA